MFQFPGNIIKNDAKKTDLFSYRVFLLRVEGGCTQVIVLLITSDAPMTTGITCISMATFVQAYF